MDAADSRSRALRRWGALALTSAAAGAGVVVYLNSPAHAQHDPFHALQQFDAFYLDEPAPSPDRLGLEPGRPAIVFFCGARCDPPDVRGAQVVRTSAPDVAREYGLLGEDGEVGTGYALVDSQGRLRYRTFDPGLYQKEIQILVDALP